MLESKTPLYELQFNQERVYCNAWACHQSNDRNYLVFASLIGPPATIRSVRRQLSKGSEHLITLLPRGLNPQSPENRLHQPVFNINPALLQKCRHHSKTLPSQDRPLTQLIVWPGSEKQHSYALSSSLKQLPEKFLQGVLASSTIMALPQWADDVYQYALEYGHLQPLQSHNVYGCYDKQNFADLKRFIQESLKDGLLPIHDAEPTPENPA